MLLHCRTWLCYEVNMLPRTVEYWLGKAEEAKTIAEGMRSVDGRRTMLDIASQYEALARQTQELEEKCAPLSGSMSRSP
jgi:hypothetical protein